MSKIIFRANPWDCEWSLIKETLVDALGSRDNDTETILRLIETFAKMELGAIRQYEETEAVRISHLNDTLNEVGNDDLDIEF